MCTDVLILAGGSGERLWPVSDNSRPKQFMTLSDGVSFLQAAISRAIALDIEGEICIVTRREWAELVIADVVALASSTNNPSILSKVLVMSEPCGKNTAPAIVWTAKYLLGLKREHSVNMLLMASDHIIKPIEAFINDVKTASWHAERGNLVSFAIPPVNPSTGYGYIRAGDSVSCPVNNSSPSFRTDSFREKPDSATARAYVDDGHYYWNSGIYAFRADFYLSESGKYSPDVIAAFSGLGTNMTIEYRSGIRVLTNQDGLDEAYQKTPSISIDYAISEKCKDSITVRSSFQWDDVGTWDSLAKYFDDLPLSAAAIESKNCFVNSDIPVALCGVNDLVVIIKNGKALIARKGETNLVKDALAVMKKKGFA